MFQLVIGIEYNIYKSKCFTFSGVTPFSANKFTSSIDLHVNHLIQNICWRILQVLKNVAMNEIASLKYAVQCVKVLTFTTLRIFRSSGSITFGPLSQFRPTIAAPASSNLWHASYKGTPSTDFSDIYGAMVITAGNPV